MTIKAVIFDLDGTLLNTLDDIADAMNRVLQEGGWPLHDRKAYEQFVGEGARELVFKAMPESARSEQMIEQCLEKFIQDYGLNCDCKTAPYQGINVMLDKLYGSDLKLAILSNKPQRYTQKCIDRYFEAEKFFPLFGQRDHVPRKPDPAGALEIAELLGMEPSDFLYVGDTPIDMQTANRAQMTAVGVLWGFRPKNELVENGAQHIVEHPSEVLKLLGL